MTSVGDALFPVITQIILSEESWRMASSILYEVWYDPDLPWLLY